MQNVNQAGQPSRIGVLLLKMAVIYLSLGLFLGLGMAISGQFQLRAVHTHINLLGWVTLAIAGMVYCLFPRLGLSRLAHWHAWLHNLGLPMMMTGLSLYHLGYREFEPLLGIGSVITVAGLVLFGTNVFSNLETGNVEDSPPERTALLD